MNNPKWLRTDTTVYELDDDDTNLWFMRVYAGVSRGGERMSDSQLESIATLAQAAPDLYEVLWTAVEHNALIFGEDHNTVIDGRAALAKARGES